MYKTQISILLLNFFFFSVVTSDVFAVNVTLTANSPNNSQEGKDYIVVEINQDIAFGLFAEFNEKPEATEEFKPGNPEWNFFSMKCSPDEKEVKRTIKPAPETWYTGKETFKMSDSVNSSKKGTWKLTYTVRVRFPKLLANGKPEKPDSNGKATTFYGPYSASATVIFQVTDAKFKIWIESTDPEFTSEEGHSLYRLGLKETGKYKSTPLIIQQMVQ